MYQCNRNPCKRARFESCDIDDYDIDSKNMLSDVELR